MLIRLTLTSLLALVLLSALVPAVAATGEIPPPPVVIEDCDGPIQYVLIVGIGGDVCSRKGDVCSGSVVHVVLIIGNYNRACMGTREACDSNLVHVSIFVGNNNSGCGSDGTGWCEAYLMESPSLDIFESRNCFYRNVHVVPYS